MLGRGAEDEGDGGSAGAGSQDCFSDWAMRCLRQVERRLFDYNWSVDEGEKPASLFVFADSQKIGTVDTKNMVVFQDGEKVTVAIELGRIVKELDMEAAAHVAQGYAKRYGEPFPALVPWKPFTSMKRYLDLLTPRNGD